MPARPELSKLNLIQAKVSQQRARGPGSRTETEKTVPSSWTKAFKRVFLEEKVNELGVPATSLPQLPSQTQLWTQHTVAQHPPEMVGNGQCSQARECFENTLFSIKL